MAGVVMKHVPASLAEQQKHPFRWAVGSHSRISRAAMFAREINCLIARDGHPGPYRQDDPARRRYLRARLAVSVSGIG